MHLYVVNTGPSAEVYTESKINVIQQKDTENTKDGTSKQWGSLKVNSIKNSTFRIRQRKQISRTYNKEGGIGKRIADRVFFGNNGNGYLALKFKAMTI